MRKGLRITAAAACTAAALVAANGSARATYGGATNGRIARATRDVALVTTTIEVTMFNSSYHLSAKTAPRGVVIFKVATHAIFGHDFSINGHTTPVLKKGQSATLRVTFLKPGHYVYKDTVDHHVRWGDIGGFTIT